MRSASRRDFPRRAWGQFASLQGSNSQYWSVALSRSSSGHSEWRSPPQLRRRIDAPPLQGRSRAHRRSPPAIIAFPLMPAAFDPEPRRAAPDPLSHRVGNRRSAGDLPGGVRDARYQGHEHRGDRRFPRPTASDGEKPAAPGAAPVAPGRSTSSWPRSSPSPFDGKRCQQTANKVLERLLSMSPHG